MLPSILTLISWTLVIWVWMYVTRIPAMKAAGINPQDAAEPGALAVLPAGVRQIADNYNHLHEQPTLFYALAFYTHLAGTADAVNIQLAWAYVGLRVVHSLIQCTVNIVMARFIIFMLSSLVLLALAVRNMVVVLS